MFYLKVATDVALIASTGRLFHRTDPLYISVKLFLSDSAEGLGTNNLKSESRNL